MESEKDLTIPFVTDLNISTIDVFVGFGLLILSFVMATLGEVLHIRSKQSPLDNRIIRSPPKDFENIEGYNFAENFFYFRNTGIRVHYLDEGPRSSKVLLCLHGTPFWSHSFRKVIPIFAKHGYRVIAPDFIGFGKSDKLVDHRNYDLENLHGPMILDLLERVTNVTSSSTSLTLIGHNWGALLGSLIIAEHPDLFDRFVILNTNNLPDGEKESVRFGLNLAAFSRFLVVDAYFLTFRAFVILMAQNHIFPYLFLLLNKNYTKQDLNGFMAPFLRKESRGGATAFPLLVPVYPNDRYVSNFREARRFFHYRWKKPTLILFSEPSSLPLIDRGDFLVGNRKSFFEKLIPHAAVVNPPISGGHVIMYDNPKIVSQRILEFLYQD